LRKFSIEHRVTGKTGENLKVDSLREWLENRNEL
jgi:hypothetical protein